MMIDALSLRSKENLNRIPNDKPGYYKWWADKKTFELLLDKFELDIDFESIEPYLDKQDDLYCIYVGIAVNESIRNRLNWHVNDEHSASRVKSGYLSTLRQSISSLISHDQYDKESTNEFIDFLKVEYFSNENKIKSDAAKQQIHNTEKNLLKEYLYILNIQENKHPAAVPFKKKLRILRKQSK